MASAKSGCGDKTKIVFISFWQRKGFVCWRSLAVHARSSQLPGQTKLIQGKDSPAGEQFVPEFIIQQRLFQKISFIRRRRRRDGLERQAHGDDVAGAGQVLRLDFSAMMMRDEKAGHEIDAV